MKPYSAAKSAVPIVLPLLAGRFLSESFLNVRNIILPYKHIKQYYISSLYLKLQHFLRFKVCQTGSLDCLSIFFGINKYIDIYERANHS